MVDAPLSPIVVVVVADFAAASASSNACSVAASTTPVGSRPRSPCNFADRGAELVRPRAVDRAVPVAQRFQRTLDRRVVRRRGGGRAAGLGLQRRVERLSVGPSTSPVTGSPASFCNASTAATVWGPYTPSTLPV